jgi:hypothetical protein
VILFGQSGFQARLVEPGFFYVQPAPAAFHGLLMIAMASP